jgi:monovalent cation/hydrogen antiporter
VLFRFAVAAAVTGTFSAMDALGSFALLTLGGAAVGTVVGGAWVFVVKRLGDVYLVIASTVLMGWAAYILAETLHVSGVIATVVAGLICGWYQHAVFSAAIRLRGTSFWTVLIFLLEASVFMLIGSSLRDVIHRAGGFGVVVEHMTVPILLILVALTVARFAWIFACDGVIALRRKFGWRRFETMGWQASTVLSWAGMAAPARGRRARRASDHVASRGRNGSGAGRANRVAGLRAGRHGDPPATARELSPSREHLRALRG